MAEARADAPGGLSKGQVCLPIAFIGRARQCTGINSVRAPIASFVVSVLLAICSTIADGEEVLVRSRLSPASNIVVGQSVDLLVDVLFPDRMPRPPLVDVPVIQGAQIFRFETQG